MAIEQREARTIRLPKTLIREAQAVRADGESLNDLITVSLEREVTRRRALKALDELAELREQIRADHGIHPDSTQLIRHLREGIGRRD